MKRILNIKSDSSKTGKTLVKRALKYTGVIFGSLLLICVLIIFFFPDPIINSFFKSRIDKALTNEYPAYTIKLGKMHYSFWKNRLGSDSITMKSNDSALTFKAVSVNVSGISWIKVLLQGGITQNNLPNMVVDAQNVSFNFRKPQDEIRFAKLHISAPDSEITVDSVKYHSLMSEEHFFAKSKFRQTKVSFDIYRIVIAGWNSISFLKGEFYNARSIKIYDAFTDILINMDKPYNVNSVNPLMPNEALMPVKESIKIDSVKIINGQLKYSERYAVNAIRANIHFTKINALVKGIANHSAKPDTAIIKGEGLFMNSGMMKMSMEIPLTSKKFSLHYSGSVGPMDATSLNAFVVTAENHRIKSGNLQSASFNINVNSGFASGSLRAEYRDLTIAILNKETGSEKGIFNKIASLFGKIFIIRGSNIPDENGKLKIGEIKYTRKPTDYFTQYLWFALRGGIADVAGFPRE